jgi:hypothetical protein
MIACARQVSPPIENHLIALPFKLGWSDVSEPVLMEQEAGFGPPIFTMH